MKVNLILANLAHKAQYTWRKMGGQTVNIANFIVSASGETMGFGGPRFILHLKRLLPKSLAFGKINSPAAIALAARPTHGLSSFP